jgi:sRNA-binding regulator protein Hfq
MDNTLQNRRLVRPRLNEAKTSSQAARTTRKKQVPPERTNAEAFYYLKQMNNRTPMKVILMDGEILEGHIEWYDKHCLKINRESGPNLLVMKSCVKYMYKAHEEDEDKFKSKSDASDSQAENLDEAEELEGDFTADDDGEPL